MLTIPVNVAILNTLPYDECRELDSRCHTNQHNGASPRMPIYPKRNCPFTDLAQRAMWGLIKINISLIKVANLFSHVGCCKNLLVNVPNPAIKYHGMVMVVLGLVGHYTKSVVVPLQETKDMTTKRNKPNLQQLWQSSKQLQSNNCCTYCISTISKAIHKREKSIE